MNAREYRRRIDAARPLQDAAKMTAVAGGAEGMADPRELWQPAIADLGNPAASPADRAAALQILKAASFLTAEFDDQRPAFIESLRTAAVTGDADLRRSAFDLLSNLKDDFARDKLTAGLRGEGEALVPMAAALGFLARDDHHSVSDIARDVLISHTDPDVREQAVRLLSSDPSAKALLSGILEDKSEFRQVRRASAVALRNIDAAAFTDKAKDILSDRHEFVDIKKTVGGALDRAGIALPAEPTSPLARLFGVVRSLLSPRRPEEPTA